MDTSLTFARHFARLVWLMLHEEERSDAQLATLRALVAATRERGARLERRGWRVFIDDVSLPERFVGAQELTAQLIGHSVTQIRTDPNARTADLLGLAHLLASPALPAMGAAPSKRV